MVQRLWCLQMFGILADGIYAACVEATRRCGKSFHIERHVKYLKKAVVNRDTQWIP